MNENFNLVEYADQILKESKKAVPVRIGGIDRLTVKYEEYKQLVEILHETVTDYMRLVNIIECAKLILSGTAEIEVNTDDK